MYWEYIRFFLCLRCNDNAAPPIEIVRMLFVLSYYTSNNEKIKKL